MNIDEYYYTKEDYLSKLKELGWKSSDLESIPDAIDLENQEGDGDDGDYENKIPTWFCYNDKRQISGYWFEHPEHGMGRIIEQLTSEDRIQLRQFSLTNRADDEA